MKAADYDAIFAMVHRVVDPNAPDRAQTIEALAQEIVRQMEWARRGCAIVITGGEALVGHVSNQGEQQYGDIYRTIPPLTVAPPGWKPNPEPAS